MENRKPTPDDAGKRGREAARPEPHDNAVERLGKLVDPPGRDVTDDDLKDPGRMTPGSKPVDNRS